MIEPSLIYENMKKNLNLFSAQEKKVAEKVSLLNHYKKYNLVSGHLLSKLDLDRYTSYFPAIEDQMKAY